MPDQDRHVIGDTELVDLVEVDAASAERPGEGPAVAVDNALSATHAHSHDVDELGVIDEQLAELVGVLRIQGPCEGDDQFARTGERGHDGRGCRRQTPRARRGLARLCLVLRPQCSSTATVGCC